jgi:MOSC domain-containing protein YiiM
VYCYPVEHYEYWRQELPGRGLPHGSSGENFTVEGLSDDSVAIGDRFVIGSAEMIVTQPRLPCYKLGVKFQSDDMVKRFLASCRTGFYFTVTREEEVGAGDEITKISNTSHSLPVAEITNLYVAKRFGEAEMSMARRALSAAALPDSWKGYFRGRLEKAEA